MSDHKTLSEDAVTEIRRGLYAFSKLQEKVLAWRDKLISLGFDADDVLILNMLEAMNDFSHDLWMVASESQTKNQIEKLLEMKAAAAAANKRMPNLGFNCVQGIH